MTAATVMAGQTSPTAAGAAMAGSGVGYLLVRGVRTDLGLLGGAV